MGIGIVQMPSGFFEATKRWIEGNGKSIVTGVMVSGIAAGVAIGAVKLYHRRRASASSEAPNTPKPAIVVPEYSPPPIQALNNDTSEAQTTLSDPAGANARENALKWIDAEMQNMMIVHEMKLNLDLQIEKPEITDPTIKRVHDQVQTQLRRAHWDLLNMKLAEGDTSALMRELDSIKAMLLELNPAPAHKAKLDEHLDSKLISQMVINKAFSAQQFANLFGFLMHEVKAHDASHDEASQRANDQANDGFKAQIHEKLSCETVNMNDVLPEVLAFLIDRLQEIKLSKANWLQKCIRPVVERQGAEIERDFMTAAIREGKMTLENTRQWITQHANPSDSEEIRVRQAVRRGVMNLLRSEVEAWRNPEFPESLGLDTTNIYRLQDELGLVVLSASCLVGVKQTVQGHEYRNSDQEQVKVTVTQEEIKELKEVIIRVLTSPVHPILQLEHCTIEFARRVLASRGLSVGDSQSDAEAFLKRVAHSATSIRAPENKVLPLVKKRLEDNMAKALLMVPEPDQRGQSKNVDVIEELKKEQLAWQVFRDFEDRIRGAFSRIEAICDLNFTVFYS